MKGTSRIIWGVVIISVIIILGQTYMKWKDNHRHDLQNLLAPYGIVFIEDASVVAWDPDANYKPQAYYLQRSLDETTFRRLAKQTGLSIVPSPEVVEAIWRLPVGLKLPGWTPQDIPPNAGIQASGTVGAAAVWLRWYNGNMFLVALPSM